MLHTAPGTAASTFAPLRHTAFRLIWLVWLAANLTIWMNDVASSWRMTTLTGSALMVALVQSAATLPLFLLGLPCGALADILDRRLYLAFTHAWVAVVAMVLAALTMTDMLDAHLLLAGAFCNGVGMAMRWPLFAAIVPDLVTRAQLPAALALNGIAANLARIIGPLVAGALLASAGSTWVFVLNAGLSLAALALVLCWRPAAREHSEMERLGPAMRAGLRFVRHCPAMHIVLVRVFLFFFQVAALTALLPFVAVRLGAGPGAYTVLLIAMAGGAVAIAFMLAWLRRVVDSSTLVGAGIFAHAGASMGAVLAPSMWMAVPAVAVAGMAWLVTANALTISVQLGLPPWVRARGMAIYHMAVMGGSAAGAAAWGALATLVSVPASIATAAVAATVVWTVTRRHHLDAQNGSAFFVHQPIDTAASQE